MEKDQNQKINVNITKNKTVRIAAVIFFVIAVMFIIYSTFSIGISNLDGFIFEDGENNQQAASYDFCFDVYGQRTDSLAVVFSNMSFMEEHSTYRVEIISPDGNKTIMIDEKAELYNDWQTTLSVDYFLEAGEGYILRFSPNGTTYDGIITGQLEEVGTRPY